MIMLGDKKESILNKAKQSVAQKWYGNTATISQREDIESFSLNC